MPIFYRHYARDAAIPIPAQIYISTCMTMLNGLSIENIETTITIPRDTETYILSEGKYKYTFISYSDESYTNIKDSLKINIDIDYNSVYIDYNSLKMFLRYPKVQLQGLKAGLDSLIAPQEAKFFGTVYEKYIKYINKN